MGMTLTWKSFKVYLPDFKAWLDANIPKADGLVCSETECVIPEKSNLTPAEITLITDHFNSLTEAGEDAKRAKPAILNANYTAMKDAAISKKWDDMSILERKIVAGAELTDADKDEIFVYG